MNEPVAWMNKTATSWVSTFIYPETEPDEWIPLYTHPVKELDKQFEKGFKAGKEEGWKAHKFHHPVKELTDEEIWDVIDNCFGVHAFNLDYQISLDEAREDAFELVKAILKKA